MAGDWIKMRTDLYRDPKVCLMADLLMERDGDLAQYVNQNCQRDMTVTRNVTRNACVGGLLSVWGVMRHRGKRVGDDLVCRRITLAVLDDLSDLPGFGDAMHAVGWVVLNGETIEFPRFFVEYNSDPEKNNAAQRQRRYRERKKTDALRKPLRNGNVTESRRVEKSREEINTSKSHSLTRKPRAPDERSNHPAIKAIRDVTRKFPDKAIWDEIITRVGSDPDSALLTECYSSWIKHGFKPINYGWLFDWYLNGGPQDYGNRQSASDRNFEARVISERLLAKPRGS